MERRLISERTRAGLVAARARGRAGGRPTVMTSERLIAAQAMRARGMTLIQIAATLGVGRSSLVRALAQTDDSPTTTTDLSAHPERTMTEVLEPATQLAEQEPLPVPELPEAPEIKLLGRTARAGGEPLEALGWPAGHAPACPSCAHPTSGMEEQYAQVAGIRELVVVPLAQPCGCLIDGHVSELQLDAASGTGSWPGGSA